MLYSPARALGKRAGQTISAKKQNFDFVITLLPDSFVQ